jgi:signal transduction histidine kinase
MPEADGYTVLMELRSHPQTSEIPVIFLTAYVDRPYQRKGMNLGAADYLTKPFNAKDLLSAVHTQLEKRDEALQRRRDEIDQLRNSIILSLPHELRTPLTGIITCIDMLLIDFEDGLSPDLQRMENLLYIMQKSGKRLYALIENYLLYSQLELYAKDAEKRQLLLQGEGIYHAIESLSIAAFEVQQEFKRPDSMQINGNKDMNSPVRVSDKNLNKIAYELFSNALKFSKDGSIVTVDCQIEGNEFVFVVKDEGRGIKPDDLKNIGAYMQFERSLHEQQGMGMGLPITQRLVALHNGTMSIESELDVGTTITVKLPLMEG